MHYCARPLDVLEYYPMYKNGKFSEYAEVEALETPVTDDNRKYATKKLHIGAKLSFGELVNASVEYNLAKTKGSCQRGICCGNSQTGDCSGSKQTGAFSGSVSTGDYCTHNAAGKQCIAVGWGRENKIKGSVGSYIALAEWGENEIINAKMVKIDGEVIKADTWYMLKNGEFVECREDK